MADDHDPTTRQEFITETLDNWKPRFLANGIDYNDLERLERRIDSWDEWCAAFRAVGDDHVALGEDALNRNENESAGGHFAQAAMYYHFGSHVWHEDSAFRDETHGKAVEAFERAAPHLDPPVERIEAPSPDGGYDLPAHLCVPDHAPGDGDESPLVLVLPGSDSIKEELHWYARSLHERGLATLAIDGPGQGETWYEQPMTHRYHEFASVVIDHVEALDPPGVDTSRLGVYGVSLGGFYAAHVAANEPRIDACIGLSGKFAVGLVSNKRSDLSREQYLWALHTDSLIEADEVSERMTLQDDVENLTAPTLMVTGALDTITHPAQTERIARRAANGEFLLYEDGNHVCNNITHKVRPRVADWLRRHLG